MPLGMDFSRPAGPFCRTEGETTFQDAGEDFFSLFSMSSLGNAEPDPGNLAPLVSQGGLRVGAIPPLSRPKMSIRTFGMFLGG